VRRAHPDSEVPPVATDACEWALPPPQALAVNGLCEGQVRTAQGYQRTAGPIVIVRPVGPDAYGDGVNVGGYGP